MSSPFRHPPVLFGVSAWRRLSGMSDDDETIAGELGQGDRPNWEPLEAMVGEELAGEFMWMFQVDLADGAAVHAYKHIFTRRYLHIGEDGRTMAFTYSGRYRAVDPFDLLMVVFEDWERFSDDKADVPALRAALRKAYQKALAA
jgi:hypothetical protein